MIVTKDDLEKIKNLGLDLAEQLKKAGEAKEFAAVCGVVLRIHDLELKDRPKGKPVPKDDDEISEPMRKAGNKLEQLVEAQIGMGDLKIVG